MSQVIRKYNSGGQTDKPKLLSIKGLGDFNQDDLIKRGYRDVDEYTSSKGLKNAAAADFRNAVQYMLEGMNNGTITMDAMGNFQDATGQKSSTGELDRKKFLGIKTGVKNTENNAYGLAADYLYNIIKGAPQYKQPKVKAEKFNTNDYLTKEISKRWYGGNNIDFGNWFKNRSEKDRNALIANIFNSADYNKLYQEHDWTDTGINSVKDLIARGRAFGSAISNNKLDNDDYNTFATLGGSDLDKFMKAAVEAQPAQAPAVEGQQGRTDRGWSNSKYDRTIDEKGQYHIYKKGTNQEVSGILPGNVFEGVGNKYAFNGNIYDDSNLPEQYRQDITRARQAQLNEYTRLTDNNPFTKMLRGRGYNYITNLSQFASGAGDNILYGAYSDPSDVSGKSEFYLKNPTTGEVRNGSVEFNKSLGQYQFVGSDGNIVNLGTYNPAGARSNQGTSFIDYSDVSESNRDNLFSAWMNDSGLNNPASDAYKMVQSTLSKWISSGQSPFVSYKGQYQWKSGDDVMNVRKGPDGQWQWSFNKGFDNSQTQKNERLEALLRIPINQRTKEINDEILRLRGYRKEGGVITAQLGTKFTKVEDTPSVTRPKISEEQAKKNQAAHQSFTGRSNASLGNDKDITDAGGVIKTSDKVRLGAAMADLASVGLGFVPGANLASVGIGVGSSLAEFGADWAGDGLDLGDAGRLAMNLGMDALSLIPVGKTLKATRALGKIRKSIPLIMTAVNAANFLDPTLRAEYSKTLSKLTKGDIKSLNTGDFKNLSAIASTVLMGKNYAQSKKGWWNSSTTPSGKRKVTAMIDGKQQTLEVDDAFFQNIKGKNQVSELKAKFAQQYNKANNLEGDNAIKPESVSIDTKYFGLRPRSEKVEGTKNAGNWAADTKIGNYWLGYRDASRPRGNANIPFSDAWFYKNGIVGGRTRAEENDIRNRWAESRKRAGEIKNKRDSEIAQKGVEGVSNLVQALNYASKYRTAPLALPAPGQATPSNRVFVMGDGRQRQPLDRTDPSKLSKPGTYQDRAVHTGGTPVESPNANKVVASQTIQPSQRLDQFIEGQIPGGRQFGRQRAKTEREYRDVFHPVAEREYNAVWDEAVRNRKDFGYEEVFPKRSPYAPPTPTEVYVVPEGAMKDPNARYLWELINKKPNTNHTKRADLPHKKSNKKKKTSKDDRVTKKAEGGLIQFLQGGGTANPSGIKRVTSTPKKKLKLNVAPEEVLALGRMVGGLAANNRVAKVYKEGLKPTLLDTFENTVPLQGNFQAKTNAEQQAGNLESVAARPRTSDASLQLAGELEASDRAGQARFQGGLQDAEMFYKTRMLGQQESDAAKARRVEVANRNRASMNAIDAAKKQIDAGRITANYQQVIAPYLAGVENRFRQARGMKNQLALESYLNRVGSEYDAELAKIGETYKNDPVGAQREISKLRSKYQSDALKERTSLIDTPWLVRFSGKGSKLSYAEKAMLQRAKDFNKRLSDDNKQFHKDIMESKREHNKMIANMSALTAALIKKGMQL